MAASSRHRSNTRCGSKRERSGGETYSSVSNGRNSFLTTTLAPIPSYEILNDEAAFDVKDCDKIISKLRDDVRKFFASCGINASTPELSGCFKRDLQNLYDAVQNHLPDKDWQVECIKADEDSTMDFVVYKPLRFPEYTVWAIPIKKMQSANPKTRRLLALTFAVMHHKDMFSYPEESYDFQYALGQCENNFTKNEDGETMYDAELAEFWGDGYAELVSRYLDGDIASLIGEIEATEDEEQRNGIQDDIALERLIAEYRAEGCCEPKLLDCIEEVLAICREDWLVDYHIGTLKNYYGEDFDEDDYCEEPMDFARLFFFCFDAEDYVTDNVINMLNADGGNVYVGYLCTYSPISDNKVVERMASDFPTRWYKAYERFIDILRNE